MILEKNLKLKWLGRQHKPDRSEVKISQCREPGCCKFRERGNGGWGVGGAVHPNRENLVSEFT